MATERNDVQLAWEEQYVKKVNFWHEVDLLVLKDRAAVKAAAASAASVSSQAGMTGSVISTDVNSSLATDAPLPADFAWQTGAKILEHEDQKDKQVVSGYFAPPSGIQLARISGDKVVIPSTPRKDYTTQRVKATEQTQAAGFMSINPNLFNFAFNAEDENIFAPDFVAVLAMIHPRIKHLFPNEKVKINSGYRWWNETKSIEYSPHEAGVAVDIGTRDPNGSINMQRAYEIADTCWEMGLRGVFIGQTFVHVDICPDGGGYKYAGVPMYRGPESH